MASDEHNQAGSSGKDDPNEKELSERRRQLGERLDAIKAGEAAQEAKVRREDDTPSSIGKAMRLSSEFVAGIVAGGLIGWVLDTFVGTKPWGLIIFLMLGFAAGIRNLLRASNMLGKTPGKQE
jgi:ATP synthase protein I